MKLSNIALFGRRNVGKSTIMNLLIGQDFSIVSETPGTTTDPTKKRIEIFGIGPVNIYDTAGLDDEGELGLKRIQKTKNIILQIDLAILVFTDNEFGTPETELLEELNDYNIPAIIVHNKSDQVSLDEKLASELSEKYAYDILEFSAKNSNEEQKELLISYLIKGLKDSPFMEKTIFEGLISEGDKIVLVCPIDSETPEGRLILPQVMAIRDLLDKNAVALVVKLENLKDIIDSYLSDIKMVVTDSQIFKEVAKIIPHTLPVTSFSILLARMKGAFGEYLDGTLKIANLKDGDRILILESCTHHASCEDIGRVKLPNMFRNFTGRDLKFDFVHGVDTIKGDIESYALVVQCGGCMVTKRQLMNRLKPALDKKVPVTNYGMSIAYMNSILYRAIAPVVNSSVNR